MAAAAGQNAALFTGWNYIFAFSGENSVTGERSFIGRCRRLAFCLSAVLALAGGHAAAAPTSDADLARSVADLGGTSCFAIATGTIALPAAGDPDAADKARKTMEAMGLTFGLNDSMMDRLGNPGLAMISQAFMGSKSFDQGDVVLAVGGSQPGCRVILLSEPATNITDAVTAQLAQRGWRPIPSMTGMRGPVERRAFFRRDDKGSPYLMNLMTITSPAPDSKVRLFTTTIRIPDNVQLPEGL
jgi:hypothetical protein